MNKTVLKNILTKEILDELYLKQKLTRKQIANKLNVKISAINRCLFYNRINRNSDPRRINIDKDILFKLYVIEKKKKPEIMKILKVCK